MVAKTDDTDLVRDRFSSFGETVHDFHGENVTAAEDGCDVRRASELMDINQGLLNALQVSSPEIEELVAIARRSGALGAKLTGGGGGGAMIAVAEPGGTEPIIAAMLAAGYTTYLTEIR